MKKIAFLLITLVCALSTQARIVKITTADGTDKYYATTELSAIDFNDDGTFTVTDYKGEVLDATGAQLSTLSVSDKEIVYEREEHTLAFSLDLTSWDPEPLSERDAVIYKILYPSQDPYGNTITLSGTITIPKDIYDGEVNCDGILMWHHFTSTYKNQISTRGYLYGEGLLLANPIKPNYIIVSSDFYGFGATERFPQAYLCGTTNAQAMIDILDAGRRILDAEGIDYGPLIFNAGYSSSGYDALATQKLRDMKYADHVSFDKTFAGGSPSDVCRVYTELIKQDTTAYNVSLPLVCVAYNETYNLGLDYTALFQSPVPENINDWILSKNYSTFELNNVIGREKHVSDIMQPAYCDLNSPESLALQELLKKFDVSNDWEPDLNQRIFIYHSRGDDYIPVNAARPLVRYLSAHGMKASVIPHKTPLQTNFLVSDLGHLTGTLVYLVQTIAQLKAWPVMYKDGHLRLEVLEKLNGDIDVVELMRQLDLMGIDCRGLILSVINTFTDAEGNPVKIDLSAITMKLAAICEKNGIDLEELLVVLEDCGISVEQFINDLLQYFAEYNPCGDEAEGEPITDKSLKVKRACDKALAPRTAADDYAKQLLDWFSEVGIR